MVGAGPPLGIEISDGGSKLSGDYTRTRFLCVQAAAICKERRFSDHAPCVIWVRLSFPALALPRRRPKRAAEAPVDKETSRGFGVLTDTGSGS